MRPELGQAGRSPQPGRRAVSFAGGVLTCRAGSTLLLPGRVSTSTDDAIYAVDRGGAQPRAAETCE
eukprot:1987623-Pyramimonas_sp.AAC.1